MLTTLESVKAWLGEPTPDAARVSLINSLIASCSNEIIKYLERNIESDVYEEIYSGSGKSYLTLKNYPIQTVLEVIINGITYREVEPRDFTTRGIKFSDRVLNAQGFCFPRGEENIFVYYLAGYDEVPPDIQQACNELVSIRLKNERGDRAGVSSKSLAGESISFFHGAMPQTVKSALNDYINVVPI